MSKESCGSSNCDKNEKTHEKKNLKQGLGKEEMENIKGGRAGYQPPPKNTNPRIKQ